MVRFWLKKIKKYYNHLNKKPSYILALSKFTSFLFIIKQNLNNSIAVLHLYYKLAYIKQMWGGAEEQAAEIVAGNPYGINWQDEARKIIEKQ